MRELFFFSFKRIRRNDRHNIYMANAQGRFLHYYFFFFSFWICWSFIRIFDCSLGGLRSNVKNTTTRNGNLNDKKKDENVVGSRWRKLYDWCGTVRKFFFINQRCFLCRGIRLFMTFMCAVDQWLGTKASKMFYSLSNPFRYGW